jgi:serine/threonine-protein kinase HipA
MRKLNVFFEDNLVGVFSQNDEMIHSFQYAEDWIKSDSSFPISISMPLQKEEFGNKITLAFFENLLPEGNVRALLEKWHHSEGAFNTLLKYGEDCAGALVITSKNSPPHVKVKEDNIEIDFLEIYKSIDESKSAVDLIADKNPGYLSIAGAQDKFPCIYEEGKIYLPKSGAPTTHIVKTPIIVRGIKESVYNEYFCMKLAAKIGFEVPNVHVIDGKHPLFLVERYDRCKVGKVMKRVHQQDFCQAQGILSSEKYESEGGPSLESNFKLMIENVAAKKRVESTFRFIDWICFNLLIGNNDSHSKNISFLMVDGKYELSPFYDLISTAIYPTLDSSFSFKIGDVINLSNIGSKALAKEEEKLGIKAGTIMERMNLVYDKIVNHQDEIIKEMGLEFPNAKIHKRIKELIFKRAKNFRKAGLKNIRLN